MVTPGFRDEPGGVEGHVSEIVRATNQLGAQIEVVTGRRSARRRHRSDHPDCRSTVYPAWAIRSMSVAPRIVFGGMHRHRRSQVVHVHSYHASTALAVLRSSRPTVFTPHYHGSTGHSPAARLLHRFYRHLGARIIDRSDAIICVSQAESALLARDFPASSGKITVIPNGVRIDKLQRARPWPITDPIVLCVGRLEKYKRFADVISAFAYVAPPARLIIIGDGQQRSDLEAQVRQSALGKRVEIIGRATDADLHRWFRTAKVLVSISRHEAFGMAPLEAAAAGARVILSDIPAHREIAAEFLGEAASIGSYASPRELAAAIESKLKEVQAPPTERIPAWSSVAERTLAIYRCLLMADRMNGVAPPRDLTGERT
ncbi:glycosyltransferase family 4 protein [Mycolicibacterium sp. Y3]